MKLVLDTCVLYPTVMREMLLGCAGAGFFAPLWSETILGEWQHTAAKLGPAGAVQGAAEITLARAAYPSAVVPLDEDKLRRFWLPDAGDVHVLAAAVLGGADGIVTVNNKDFPRGLLAEEGLARMNPDALLLGFWEARPEDVCAVASKVLAQANAMDAGGMDTGGMDTVEMASGGWTYRSLLKKARLPRLGKALDAS